MAFYVKLGALFLKQVCLGSCFFPCGSNLAPERPQRLYASWATPIRATLVQVSKPLASQLKTQATTHPMLRRVVTRLGQKMHEWCGLPLPTKPGPR